MAACYPRNDLSIALDKPYGGLLSNIRSINLGDMYCACQCQSADARRVDDACPEWVGHQIVIPLPYQNIDGPYIGKTDAAR